MSSFFHPGELDHPYQLKKDILPSKTDCLLYVVSRTQRGDSDRKSTVIELAREVEQIWKAADCCPLAFSNIVNVFEKHVWQVYLFLKREQHLPNQESGNKRSHKKVKSTSVLQPVRKSARRGLTKELCEDKEDSSEEVLVHENTSTPVKQRTRSSDLFMTRKIWDESEGNTLFDVISSVNVQKSAKNKLAFDKTFYEDQKSEKKLKMMINKVTVEFIEAEKRRMRTEALAQARKDSAYASVPKHQSFLEEDKETEETVSNDNDLDFDTSKFKSPTIHSTGRKTRNSVLISPINTMDWSPGDVRSNISVDESRNEISVLDTKVRVMAGRDKNKTNLVEPRYLEAISLLMSDNLSASEAIKSVYIVDTVIWKQKRHLPLEMDKDYVNLMEKLKKLEAKKKESETLSSKSAQTETLEPLDQLDLMSESEVDAEIKNLKSIVEEKINIRQVEKEYTLPSRKCVRQNHNLMAVHCEGKVAEEILQNKGFLIPDGTKRQGLGEIAASVVKVGDKIRSLKASQLTSSTRSNWAKYIHHLLDRLATAGSTDIEQVWQKISAFLSDLCKVNLHLSKSVQQLIGSKWIPGQAFCNLHFTLAIPVAIKEVLAEYQTSIGASKLFPKCVGFEMNLEDKLIVIQILDCWMRLTSIRWHSRSWNRYDEFTEYAEKKGLKNVGHMLHANRFGEFEERCAGGLYLAKAWAEWLENFTDVRNQLACYLREVSGIMDQCMFLWAGASLIGLHITVPFMSMLLDHQVTPRMLLKILPDLYKDLVSYENTMCQIDECGIAALAPYFLNPTKKETSPYGVNVAENIRDFLNTVDLDVMNMYLKLICTKIAKILKRQRGNQYGFGDDAESNDCVLKNMSEEMLDDNAATHSKPIENLFGNLDRELQKTGSRGFNKVADDLVIKYAKDIIVDDKKHTWRSKENRVRAAILKEKEAKFIDDQKKLALETSCEKDASRSKEKNKVLECITNCKKHKGPFTTIDELKLFVSSWPSTEKALHRELNLEIRLHKLTLTKMKVDSPLFRQVGLSVEQKVKNLESLIGSQLDMQAKATMEDLEIAILGCSDSVQVDERIADNTNPPQHLEEKNDTEFEVGENVVALFTEGHSRKKEPGFVSA